MEEENQGVPKDCLMAVIINIEILPVLLSVIL